VNALGLFLTGTGLSNAAFAQALTRMLDVLGENPEEVAGETVRRWTQDIASDAFNRPKAAFMKAIFVLTDGKVRPETFAAMPALDDRLRVAAKQIIADVAANARQRRHQARAKGAKMSARSRAKMRGQARRAGA
jgi:hypothetical protein